MNNELTTLINTLMQNNLAGSLEEARRMAESMLGTSSKVSKAYEENSEHFMIKGYKKSESDVLGNGSNGVKDHPPAFEDLQKEIIHQHEKVEEKPSQMLTLDNPTSYQKQALPEPTGSPMLSLQNTVTVSQRPKQELQEGVLAQGMPDTSAITNSQRLDPVTSAPLDIAPEKTQAQIPADNPSEFRSEIMQQVRERAEQVDKGPEPLPSLDPLQIAQRVPRDLTPGDLTPEQYAEKQLGGGLSLNDLSKQEEQHKVINESIEQVRFEHPQHLPQEVPEDIQKDECVEDLDVSIEQVHFEHPQQQEPSQHLEDSQENLQQVSQQSSSEEKPFSSLDAHSDSHPVSSPFDVDETVAIELPGFDDLGRVEVPENQLGVPNEYTPEPLFRSEPASQEQVQQPQQVQEQVQPQQNQEQFFKAPEPIQQVSPPAFMQEEQQPEHTQQIPTAYSSEQKNEFGTPKREKVELSPEEKKLKEDVDLSKIFNVGSR
jgi:hypothetical protein